MVSVPKAFFLKNCLVVQFEFCFTAQKLSKPECVFVFDCLGVQFEFCFTAQIN